MVLLIHAGIADRTMWEPQWGRWQERFTLIRYDLRGIGESAEPKAPYALHEDALEVIDAAGIERAAVLGVSVGGMAALDLALAAPDRVTALVAVAATPSGWEHSADLTSAWERLDEAYERGGLEAVNEEELRMWVDGPRRRLGEVDAALREKVARMNLAALEREEAREKAATAIEPVSLEPPALARLGDLAAPTLVVTGALDQPSVNAGAAALAAGAGTELVEIPDASHLPSLERPDEFDRAVLRFLDRHA